MNIVGINNPAGVGRSMPCPSPSKGIRTHSWASGDELQALAASPRSWQRAQPSSRSTRHQGPPARPPCRGTSSGAPSLPFPIILMLGQPPSTARGTEWWEGAKPGEYPTCRDGRNRLLPERKQKALCPSRALDTALLWGCTRTSMPQGCFWEAIFLP